MKKKIKELKPNKNNPRVIRGNKFDKLVNSIKEFPEMLELRPIVVDEDMVILGGNMRYKACIEAGLKEVPIKVAKGLNEAQKREFIIKDNVGFGEWDWDNLANDWDNKQITDWGLDVWQPEDDVDYSALDDFDLGSELEDKEGNVKRAIQIEFEAEHYDEATEIIKFFRERGANIGAMILEYLKAEKKKL
mgnify:CR=1 FL=1|tara:strand:- start:5742 stop:6311 length:570 start_codon:yes stop_codon:yes gene_type:complete